jgi:peptidyl-tRNA hydrolase, PTH2 family
MSTTKQVIVMRTDLGMRKGKMVAQGAHASIGWLTHRPMNKHGFPKFYLTDAERDWIANSFTKICVGVGSLEELVDIYNSALEEGIHPINLVTDNGATEFHGERTPTCLAIGPYWSEDIDKVTGHLTLL